MLRVGPELRQLDVRLPHQLGLRVVLGGDRLPASVDLVHLGPPAKVALAVAQLAVLDQPVRDVDAEARDAAVEPVAEDPVEFVPHVRVPPVEIRLLDRELVQVVALAARVVLPRSAAGEDRPPVVRDVLRPDVVLRAVAEPRVAVGGVVRDEIEPDADAALARGGDQRVEVVERAVVGMDVEVVGDVVAPVDVRARKRRTEPDRVDAEPREVVEPARHTGQITDPVAVRIRERPHVDLVDDGGHEEGKLP